MVGAQRPHETCAHRAVKIDRRSVYIGATLPPRVLKRCLLTYQWSNQTDTDIDWCYNILRSSSSGRRGPLWWQ